MIRPLRQTLVLWLLSLRDLLVSAGPVLLLALGVLVAAYAWLDPQPPRQVTLATGQARALDFNLLCAMAGEAVARACVNAVRAARGLTTGGVRLPSAIDMEAAGARPESAGGPFQS